MAIKRTYWKWLLVNPLELTLTVGIPVILLTAISTIQLRTKRAITTNGALLFATLATWIILWLSGKNMGEAARLWILLIPLFVAGTAHKLAADRGTWTLAAICQMVICIATVTVVRPFLSML